MLDSNWVEMEVLSAIHTLLEKHKFAGEIHYQSTDEERSLAMIHSAALMQGGIFLGVLTGEGVIPYRIKLERIE